MSRPTFMTIDLVALKANLAEIRRLAPRSAIIAMVKANAYGHGLTRIAAALTDCTLGVASLEEALTLREAGIKAPIILMEGLFNLDEIKQAAQHELQLVVHHAEHLTMLAHIKEDNVFTIWLKINTGMNRLGIMPEELFTFYPRLEALSCVKKPIGLMTHFACADQLDHPLTHQQMILFSELTKNYSGPKTLANSAAILTHAETHADFVRPGLMLYGASPFAGKTADMHHLKPVMTLSSRLIAVHTVKKGNSVGYGGTWIAPQDTPIGVVGVGYGDGYPQFAQNGTPVLVNGKRSQLLGRVSMDMLTVDLSQQPQADIGDPVILWGQGLPVEIVAAHSHTSPYEILTRMTPRPKTRIIETEKQHEEVIGLVNHVISH